MKALISPLENNRICQIVSNSNTFPVAEPLAFVTCPDECTTSWTYDGTTFNPPVEALVSVITPRQIRFVLNKYNLRQAVEAAVAAADQETKDWWEFSLDFQIDHPVLQSMAEGLGLTQAQVEQMFIEAATL